MPARELKSGRLQARGEAEEMPSDLFFFCDSLKYRMPALPYGA